MKANGRHHIRNKCKGGKSVAKNLIFFHKEKHVQWHIMFGNLDFQGAIRLLERADRIMKARQSDEQI